MNELYVPALRGIFGDWVYYSCLMPVKVVAERINFAKELHKNKKLSELIQREIKKGRGSEIANYLRTQKERFFNSLVVAVYDGKPIWYEFGIKSQNESISIEDIPDDVLHSFGFLYFTGKERLFALDGQHRLAGIKQAINEGEDIEDEVSVILVGHNNTPKGLQRTRRLFTTLNKTAIPVSKGEKIALDENDVMAIVVRRLVEDNPNFTGDRIAYRATNNLLANDFTSLTTIGNLYDILIILYTKIINKGKMKELQFSRPDDKELDKYYRYACDFFDLLQENIPELKEYFKAKNYTRVAEKYRGSFGGSLVFRPIGLTMVTETIAKLSANHNLSTCVRLVAKLPHNLTEEPFADVIWDTRSHIIVSKGKVLARTLMLYMLGEIKASDKLRKSYAAALGKEVDQVQLPKPI